MVICRKEMQGKCRGRKERRKEGRKLKEALCPIQTGHILCILSSLNSQRMHIMWLVCKGYYTPSDHMGKQIELEQPALNRFQICRLTAWNFTIMAWICRITVWSCPIYCGFLCIDFFTGTYRPIQESGLKQFNAHHSHGSERGIGKKALRKRE